MAHFAGGATLNFAPGTAGQANQFWVPEIYSKKVQIALRKASTVEAICNTDYMGEIKSYGDTVNIVKEPTIATAAYFRGTPTPATALTDSELVLVIDKAETTPATAASELKFGKVATPILINHTGGALNVDPLDFMARAAQKLDENNNPEDGRWFVAAPNFYNSLSNTASKLLSVDYNAGKGSLRNGLVASGLVRGFAMYKSLNTFKQTIGGIANTPSVLFGHMRSTSCAAAMNTVESFRSPTTFADQVRGLHVYGRKVLTTASVGAGIIKVS
mgnify:CR=1 FL=1